MALTCARCGAQNPDGNQFCAACGTPLTAVAAGIPTPPPSSPPPPQGWQAAPPPPPPAAGVALAYASPPGYASPYYSPTGAAPQAPVHRTPWVLIISAVVVLIVLMAGCGTAIALLGGGKYSLNGGVSGLPSPTPGVSPSPVASPTLPPGATSVSNNGVLVPLPSGWTVASQDADSITLLSPSNSGSVTVASGPSNPKQTAQQNKDDIDKSLVSKYPDTTPCPGNKVTSGSLNGAQGLFWNLCFTLTASGRTIPAVASIFVGANSSGSVYYLVMLATAQSNLQSLTAESKPVLQGIQWKLK